MKQTYSLRYRLIIWITLPIFVAMLLSVVISYLFTRHEIEEVYDAQLVNSAKVLHQLTRNEIAEDENFHLGIESQALQHRYERKLGFRIWAENRLLAQSESAKYFGDFQAPPGFSNQNIKGNEWRFFVFLDPENKIQIEVSERYDIRYELIFQLMASLLLPFVLFIPVIFLLIWIGVRKVLKPVVTLSAEVDRRGSDDLSPIEREELPQEVAPLIQALNRLLGRLEESFKREREFTDHAAHELRTPLAAMKTQTQVILKKIKGHPDYEDGLQNLQSSIDRASHLVDQLLSLARLQNEKLPRENINLSRILSEVLSNIVPSASQKKIEISKEIAGNICVYGHSASVEILLSNLLDNAVKYTPEEGQISVHLEKDGTLRISDSGPGLSDLDKKRVILLG